MQNNKKTFKIAIRFADGEVDGRPQDRILGFVVEADSVEEAREILRKWLQKCIESLNGNSAQIG